MFGNIVKLLDEISNLLGKKVANFGKTKKRFWYNYDVLLNPPDIMSCCGCRTIVYLVWGKVILGWCHTHLA